MKLLYNGVDITSEVSINRCVYDTFAERRSDTLYLRFNDTAGLWDKWKPTRGDELRFTDESIDTGTMFLRTVEPENGLLGIRSMAMPTSCETKKSGAWENVRLCQLAEDIAKAHGMKFKQYFVTDRVYQYIEQENLTDLEFLHRRCQLEGCALVIFDKALIIYDEHAIESAPVAGKIQIGQDGVFHFYDDSALSYGSAEIINGKFVGSFTDTNAPSDRVLRPTSAIECTNNAEAIRFSRGLLRQANKNAITGDFRRRLTREYAAGSVVDIETEKSGSWRGKVFITRVRHDFLMGESKFFFRKPLEGY